MGGHLANICMLADSHGLYDDRIYWKEAVSLKRAGYKVHYILAGDDPAEGVTAEGISYCILKRDRFPANPYINYLAKRLPGGLYGSMYKKAAGLQADVYHIHDLKVNRIGKRLKALGSRPKVVYDVHEPYPENILDYWEGKGSVAMFRNFWAAHIRRWERRAAANYDLIITTEENLQQRFAQYFPEKPVEVIYNYTNLPGMEQVVEPVAKEYDAIYTGGISRFRGAWQILEAVKLARIKMPGIRVLFLGAFFPGELREQMASYIREHALDQQVVLKDAVPYKEVTGYYLKSKVGLGIFLPIHTHRIILQIKLFEYMNFGLPILGSNFGHIEAIIRRHGCGITVDPENPQDIANGLLELLSDEENYKRMSGNGMKAAATNYRWEEMEEKLTQLYQNLAEKKK